MDGRIRRLATIAGTAAMLLVVAGNVAAVTASPAKLTALAVEDSTGTPASGQAWIRVLHASPDAPAVDVYVDGAKAITGLAFGQIAPTAAPGYVPVAAGNHAIKVCATGTTTCPIDVPALAVADGKKYTIAATNALSKIETQVIEDAPAAGVADKAQVRVVHFSADTPAVDVYVNGTTKIVTNLAYPKATDYLQVAGASYAVKVCATGSTTCPINVPALAVANGKAYSVFAIGSLAAALATPAPSVTPPATDTVAGTTGTSGEGTGVALAALALVALASLGLTLPFAARRARR